MSSVELCPRLQYPSLKSPSWHCESDLYELLLPLFFSLKLKYLQLQEPHPRTISVYRPPLLHFPRQKDRNASSSSFFFWSGGKEVNVIQETAREKQLVKVACHLSDFFPKQFNTQVQVFGRNWRHVKGKLNFLLYCFQINHSLHVLDQSMLHHRPCPPARLRCLLLVVIVLDPSTCTESIQGNRLSFLHY